MGRCWVGFGRMEVGSGIGGVLLCCTCGCGGGGGIIRFGGGSLGTVTGLSLAFWLYLYNISKAE